MTDSPPLNPNVNDAWFDHGVWKFWDGSDWARYERPPKAARDGDAAPVSIYKVYDPRAAPNAGAEEDSAADPVPELTAGPETGGSPPGDTPAEDRPAE
jgi:hypothetical protein